MKIIVLLLLASCGYFFKTDEKSKLVIRNESKADFDSLNVRINKYTFKLLNVKGKQLRDFTFTKDSVSAKHDVVYSFKGFKNGALIFDDWFFSNDMGFIPDSLRVRITDSLKIEGY
jgi:hypothetical protein